MLSAVLSSMMSGLQRCGNPSMVCLTAYMCVLQRTCVSYSVHVCLSAYMCVLQHTRLSYSVHVCLTAYGKALQARRGIAAMYAENIKRLSEDMNRCRSAKCHRSVGCLLPWHMPITLSQLAYLSNCLSAIHVMGSAFKLVCCIARSSSYAAAVSASQ